YKASMGITTNMKVAATRWIAENASSLGLDSIWIGEDIGIGQDAFVLASATLTQAKGVRVGTGIVPITVHNISTLARAALTLQELGEGRFAFGIGIGGMLDLEKLAIKLTRPVTVLDDAIRTLRQLWSGEVVTFENELFQLKDYSLGLKNPVRTPIFLGVRGPQMLKLSGRLANGVILSGPFDYLRSAIKMVNDEARKAGRKPDAVEKVIWLPTIPTFKGGSEELAKKVVAIVVADMPEPVLNMLSIEKEKIDKLRAAISTGGPDGGIPFVDQELLDMFAISGDKEHIVDLFDELGRMGATEVILGPPFSGDWREASKEIFEEILARRRS
ncbi:MAG: LLM class flavin-dependent oxidoreductase, partial [Candidatus Thorarchaeota archaeon]